MEILASNEAVTIVKDIDPDAEGTVYSTFYKNDAYHEFFYMKKNAFLEGRIEKALNEKGLGEFSSIMEGSKDLVTTSSLEENCYFFNGRVYSVMYAKKQGRLFCITIRRRIPIQEINNFPKIHLILPENKVYFEGDCSTFSPEDFHRFLEVLQKAQPVNQKPKIRRVK